MKKYYFLLLPFLFFVATGCQNFEDIFEAGDCPTLTQEKVPQAVIDAFQSRYTKGEIPPEVLLWCDGKKKTYKVLFLEDNMEKVASYDDAGKFLSESVEDEDDDQEGNHEDKDKGCECELEDDDDDNGGDDDD